VCYGLQGKRPKYIFADKKLDFSKFKQGDQVLNFRRRRNLVGSGLKQGRIIVFYDELRTDALVVSKNKEG